MAVVPLNGPDTAVQSIAMLSKGSELHARTFLIFYYLLYTSGLQGRDGPNIPDLLYDRHMILTMDIRGESGEGRGGGYGRRYRKVLAYRENKRPDFVTSTRPRRFLLHRSRPWWGRWVPISKTLNLR